MAPPPFRVLPDERELYRSPKGRHVEPPLVIDVPAWTDGTGEFKRRVDRMIENARLENWIGFREKAYPGLMLEFYTSLRISGSTLHCCIRGVDKVFTPQTITEIFGCDTSPPSETLPVGHPQRYNQLLFWDEIRVPGIGKIDGYPFTAVKDNELYFMYRLVTMCILGKGEPTRITIPELKFLHALKHGQNLRLWPLILTNLQCVAEVRKAKNSNLSHGTLITLLARHVDWEPTLVEEQTTLNPVEMIFGQKQVRNPDKPKSRGDWVDICMIIEYPLRPDPVQPPAQDDSDAPESEGDDTADDQPPTDTDMAGASTGPSQPESSSRPGKRPARPEMNVPTDFWIDWEGWKETIEHQHLGLFTEQKEMQDLIRRQGVTIDGTYRETRRINTRLDVHEARQLEILAGHTRLSTQYDQILAGQAEATG
ncbi:hypothetical protein CASFOL_034675 [Castilleja foliolosa]|uniref:Uncharacterized protein n=1 Tax=Castilleja foliolosa TaxID=1961234 RepID=A0ABD3BQP2_9LAMI